jgi:hypothetical protein
LLNSLRYLFSIQVQISKPQLTNSTGAIILTTSSLSFYTPPGLTIFISFSSSVYSFCFSSSSSSTSSFSFSSSMQSILLLLYILSPSLYHLLLLSSALCRVFFFFSVSCRV